jgi:hypothetical protein
MGYTDSMRFAPGSYARLWRLIALAACGSGALLGAELPLGDATLQGQVTDAAGIPLAQAVVRLNAGDGRSLATLTDSAGQFRFADLPTGVYELSAAKPRFAVPQRGACSVDPGTHTRLDIALDPAYSATVASTQATHTANAASRPTGTSDTTRPWQLVEPACEWCGTWHRGGAELPEGPFPARCSSR